MNITEENKKAWNRLVEKGDRWTQPVSPEEIMRARKGDFSILLTPTIPVPPTWFPPLKDAKVLCLASGGGQQGPILSAAGAEVTVFDNSPLQLKQDELVAKREDLKIRTIEGDMKDLSIFANESFDFIFHPCSNGFVEAIRPVWKEAFRVLKRQGTLISGFSNPIIYIFDPELEKQNIHQLKYSLPYSDLTSLGAGEREKYFKDEPLSFGHTLEDQISGQLDAGFHLIGLYEDDWGGKQTFDKFFKSFLATRALKP